ncbi:hypothetical protein [Halomicrococcus sp. NG-SE-24]|uniref:hypothetical protein n=1 Tax=Halomicrococcus sp. NG-SE-24 TaxID=3436928 RepID=UPI003D97D837
MTDDLDERKEETWGMSEVRSTGASSETTDPSPTSDTTDTEDQQDSSDTQGTDDGSDTESSADAEDTANTKNTEQRSDSTDTSDIAKGDTVRAMAVDAEAKGFAVRDLHNVNVYLYEDIYQEMIAEFKDLDSEYFQEHGDELSKNKEFFNAVFRAGLQSSQLREELELE